MLFSKGCAALVACASLVSGQFVNPSKKTVVEVGKSIDIKWEKAGLVAPLSISLIPGGTIIQESIIIQRVAVNIGNIGLLTWTADERITALESFSMVIIDARGVIVVSDEFVINHLHKKPHYQHSKLGYGKTVTITEGGGHHTVTKTETTVVETDVPVMTEPPSVYYSGDYQTGYQLSTLPGVGEPDYGKLTPLPGGGDYNKYTTQDNKYTTEENKYTTEENKYTTEENKYTTTTEDNKYTTSTTSEEKTYETSTTEYKKYDTTTTEEKKYDTTSTTEYKKYDTTTTSEEKTYETSTTEYKKYDTTSTTEEKTYETSTSTTEYKKYETTSTTEEKTYETSTTSEQKTYETTTSSVYTPPPPPETTTEETTTYTPPPPPPETTTEETSSTTSSAETYKSFHQYTPPPADSTTEQSTTYTPPPAETSTSSEETTTEESTTYTPPPADTTTEESTTFTPPPAETTEEQTTFTPPPATTFESSFVPPAGTGGNFTMPSGNGSFPVTAMGIKNVPSGWIVGAAAVLGLMV